MPFGHFLSLDTAWCLADLIPAYMSLWHSALSNESEENAKQMFLKEKCDLLCNNSTLPHPFDRASVRENCIDPTAAWSLTHRLKAYPEMQSLLRTFKNFINTSAALQKIRVYHRIAFSPKYLLLTNVCISISLSSVGDCLEQQYELYTKDLDEYSGKRTVHMALSG